MAEDSGAPQSAAEVKDQAQEKMSGLADKAQSTAREQVDQRSTQAGEQVSSMAGELRSVSAHLASRDSTNGAKVADQVADRAEKAGSYLTESDADTILSDIEDLGRRQPLLALAGGVVIGIAAARFLKASSSSRYESRTAQPPQGRTQAYAPPAPTASLQGQEVGGEAVGAAVPPPEAPVTAIAGTPST